VKVRLAAAPGQEQGGSPALLGMPLRGGIN
jgi:hypothetical protein